MSYSCLPTSAVQRAWRLARRTCSIWARLPSLACSSAPCNTLHASTITWKEGERERATIHTPSYTCKCRPIIQFKQFSVLIPTCTLYCCRSFCAFSSFFSLSCTSSVSRWWICLVNNPGSCAALASCRLSDPAEGEMEARRH